MQMHEADEIVELENAVEVNQSLQSGEGWRLLAVVSSGHSSPTYVLGRRMRSQSTEEQPQQQTRSSLAHRFLDEQGRPKNIR